MDWGSKYLLARQLTLANVNGVAGLASPFLNFNRKRLIDLCSQYRLPSIWEAIAYIRDGGLISYGPSFPDMYRRSAGYVAKILKGTKPSELPVQQPIRFELAVNLKTAISQDHPAGVPDWAGRRGR